MMRKVLLILCVLCAVRPAGGRTMKDFFIAMPDRLLPLLTQENRLDCVDFVASKMNATVKNRFGENTTLEVLTDRYARLQLTPVSRVEMRLLFSGSDTVVCMVHTLQSVAAESKLAFYDTRWRPLAANRYVRLPGVKDFIRRKAQPAVVREVMQKVELPLLSVALDESSDTLKLRLGMDGGNVELKKELTPLVVPELIYVWQGGRFVMVRRDGQR